MLIYIGEVLLHNLLLNPILYFLKFQRYNHVILFLIQQKEMSTKYNQEQQSSNNLRYNVLHLTISSVLFLKNKIWQTYLLWQLFQRHNLYEPSQGLVSKYIYYNQITQYTELSIGGSICHVDINYEALWYQQTVELIML